MLLKCSWSSGVHGGQPATRYEGWLIACLPDHYVVCDASGRVSRPRQISIDPDYIRDVTTPKYNIGPQEVRIQPDFGAPGSDYQR